MRHLISVAVLVTAVSAALGAPITPGAADNARAAAAYGKLPLSFEPNRGQTDSRVSFLSRGPGYSLYLQPASATFRLEHFAAASKAGPLRQAALKEQAVVRMDLLGAASTAAMTPEDAQPGTVNYMTGNSRANWHTGVPTYARVAASQVYPGIDLVYYGTQDSLEYDFVIAPGADPGRIAMQFFGATPQIDGSGNLTLALGTEKIAFRKPDVYQRSGNIRAAVAGRFVLEAGNRVKFAIGDYDHSRQLVIDPVLLYSSYLGGTSQTTIIYGTALDAAGEMYITGATGSATFPTTPGAFVTACPDAAAQTPKCGGVSAAFVSKIAANGQSLVYSTYLGGNNPGSTNPGADVGIGVALDSAGHAWITGQTESDDFPITNNAYQKYCSPQNGFNVATNAYSGEASTCANGGSPDIFLVELNTTGTDELYGTFFGGSGDEGAAGIAIDSTGIYVTGATTSVFPNSVVYGQSNEGSDYQLPTTSNAFQQNNGTLGPNSGNVSGFVTKFDPTGTQLLYSSLLYNPSGNNYSSPVALAVTNGKFIIGGNTKAPDFPTTANALQKTCQLASSNVCYGQSVGTAVISVVDPTKSGDASLVYSSYLSGTVPNGFTSVLASVAGDAAGNFYAAGNTQNSNFPVTAGAQQTTCQTGGGGQCSAGFVAKFSAAGALTWATYLGSPSTDGNDPNVAGLATDSTQNVYFAMTSGDLVDLPTVHPFQANAFTGAYVGVLNPKATALTFASYLGNGNGTTVTPTAMTIDSGSNIYLVGYTGDDLPLVNAYESTPASGGQSQGFFAKIATLPVVSTTKFGSSSYTYTEGQSTAIGAIVTGLTGLPAPTGSVAFYGDGMYLTTVALTDGKATLAASTSGYAAGAYTITANYSGDGVYAKSTANVNATVNKASTTTTVTASPNPGTAGQSVALKATVAASSGSKPAGTVTFTSEGYTLGSATLSNGVATLTASTAGVPPGSYPVTASYPGDGINSASSGMVTAVLK